MSVLIVESDPRLAEIWDRHLSREGAIVTVASNADGACKALSALPIDVVVLDLDLQEGSALSVADFAAYRRPAARVIFVTATTFFSDGSIFQVIPNAAGFLRSDARPEDLAALVEHHRSGANGETHEGGTHATPAHAAN